MIKTFNNSKLISYNNIYTDIFCKHNIKSMTEGSVTDPFEPHPRILLLGLRKSGKSSIHKVVFHKMSPGDTLFLESTTQLVKEGCLFINSDIQYAQWIFSA